MRKAVRAIAVLLCAVLLLPMCGCTIEPSNFMSVEEIAEKHPGVSLQSGNNREARFIVNLRQNTSLEWMRYLTTAESVEIVFDAQARGATITLPDLSGCKKLESLRFSGEFSYHRNMPDRIVAKGYPERLDLSAIANSNVNYLELKGLRKCAIELGDGVETMVFDGTAPDPEVLAKMPNLKELQIFSDEPCDLTPLASSESLHLLHLNLHAYPYGSEGYTEIDFPEWDLSPLKDSNIDTLVLGSNLSTKLLESLDGAENIRHLQLSSTDVWRDIELINSLPNLETAAFIGLEDTDKAWVSTAKQKDALDHIRAAKHGRVKVALQQFIDRGGTVVGAESAYDYYEWYYANVD